MNDKKVVYAGPSFLSLLQIVFIVLKLCGVIKWSWLWVLAPFFAWWALVILAILIFTYAEYKHKHGKFRL